MLVAGPWVGPVTEARARAHADRLDRARTAFDLATAASAALGSAEAMSGLRRFARGDPSHDEVAEALLSWQPPAAEPVAEAVASAVAALTADPAPVERALVVKQVTAEGVVEAEVRADALGVPTLARPVRTTPWRDLEPGLPADEHARRFALAGDPEALARWARVPAEPETATRWTVLLNGVAGWRAVDTALGARRRVHRVRGAALTDEVLTGLLADAPLRLDHSLVLVDLAPTGHTMPVRVPLFAAGTVASAAPVVEVCVEGAAGREESVLAVVAGPPGAPARQCAPVLVRRCALPGDAPVPLRFSLRGPGSVELHAPVDTAPDPGSRATWPGVLAELPTTHDRRPAALDLAVAVELGGTAHQVAARRDLLLGVLDHLIAQHPAPDSVRVAVLAYEDHLGRAAVPVVSGCSLVALPRARAELAGLGATEAYEPNAAPVEDALAAAAALPWTARARRLLLVGARPPHPSKVANIPRCPNEHRWEAARTALRALGVDQTAVWDRPEWCVPRNRLALRTTDLWRDLGHRPGAPLLAGADPADVVAAAGLIPRARRPTPLRIPLLPAGPDQENSP
ncbi:hypothetical protein ACOBQX_22790 [Actinokineospora sp. G85]|uniref:hypothetical protein n=1 Tax=Actinokineospora sp. G85 TaxID=3406626 RepID=UPI003C757D36